MDGLLTIDKPAGITSHDVVVRARQILRERRIGHTGTLDPFATGVLVVLLGRATRLAQFLSGVDKEYEAIIRLGYATDTGDRTGTRLPETVQPVSGRSWSEADLEQAMQTLRGVIQQVPPMFSAKKTSGKKLYELARRGETIEREPIRVCIHEFEAIRQQGEMIKDNMDGTVDFRVRVACSSGTYIRTLAEDFGKRLSVGAHLAELRRVRVGDQLVSEAVELEELKVAVAEERLATIMVPLNAALPQLPFVHLSAEDARRTRHGMEVRVAASNWSDGANVRMCDGEGHLLAVGDYNASKEHLHPRVVLV